MAGEIQFSGPRTGATCHVLIRNNVGQIWNGSSFETYATANYATYVVTATEQGTASNFFIATFPSGISAGIYSVTAKQQLGGSPAETDSTVATGDIHWGGSALVPLSNLATSGQIGQHLPVKISRSVAVPNFQFKLVSSADHVTPFTSGVVSGQIARDGGSFGGLQSGLATAGYTEIGLGWYRVALTSGDLAANVAALNFQAVGISGGSADPRDFALLLQRVSGGI